MITNLQIENVAIIEKCELEFDDGFTVITGETGAGKSILIDSINAVMGQRMNHDIIRSGTSKAKIVAVFTSLPKALLSYLEEVGIDAQDEIMLSREIYSDGKNICRIEGNICSLSVLRNVGNYLLNIHGQHETQSLLSDSSHLHYLDVFAKDHLDLQKYQNSYQEYKAISSEMNKMDIDEQERARKIDYLSAAVEEIDQAQLIPDEETQLNDRKKILLRAEQIGRELNIACATLSGDEYNSGAVEALFQTASALSNLDDLGGAYSELAGRLNDIKYELQDIASSLQDLNDSFEYSPNELNTIEERLDTIFRLKRKYGRTIEEILDFKDRSEKELSELSNYESTLTELKKKQSDAFNKTLRCGKELSAIRKEQASKLRIRIIDELKELNMGKIDFDIQMIPNSTNEDSSLFLESGLESVRFLFSANKGEPLKPLSRIASGGELARIMLALKNILASDSPANTMIFDEIDTGISGKAAQKVAIKLAQLGKTNQVLCVTHLPQITALANHHFYIEKEETADKTVTHIKKLKEDERIVELARMLGGDSITEYTLQNAKELLSEGEKYH